MFRKTVTGRETAFVRTLNGEKPWDTQVQICLDQLVLNGDYSAVRDRVAAVLALLDDIAAHPERWQDLCWQRDPETSGPRDPAPHPLVRHPQTAW
jgi:hypothetical protein